MARLGRSQPFPPTINRLIIIESATTYILTGVSAAGVVGSVSHGISRALSQAFGVGVVGSVVSAISVSATQVSGNGVVGAVSYAEMFAGGGLRARVIGSAVIRRIS